MVFVRSVSENKEYWFYAKNKIEDFFKIDIRSIPREDGRFRISYEKYEILYLDLFNEYQDWVRSCNEEFNECFSYIK